MTDIGDLKLILSGTKYEGSAKCIEATFKNAGLKTFADLDNAPRTLGTVKVCGFSVWPLLITVRERTLNPPKPKYTRKPKAKAPKKKTVSAVKAEEVEVEETEVKEVEKEDLNSSKKE